MLTAIVVPAFQKQVSVQKVKNIILILGQYKNTHVLSSNWTAPSNLWCVLIELLHSNTYQYYEVKSWLGTRKQELSASTSLSRAVFMILELLVEESPLSFVHVDLKKIKWNL